MATIPTHALVGLATVDVVAGRRAAPRLLLLGAAWAALPDADVLLMRALHARRGDLLSHRGLTHSIAFAVVVGVATALLLRPRPRPSRARAALALVLAIATHGALDAMTDGGSGIAFLAPFSRARSFFAWRPIPVAPLSVSGFFTARGMHVFGTELAGIWVPVGVALVVLHGLRARRRRKPAARGVSPPSP